MEIDIQEIQDRIAKIKSVEDDFDVAHSLEDELINDILKAIAEGADNPQELAHAVIEGRNTFDFTHYTA